MSNWSAFYKGHISSDECAWDYISSPTIPRDPPLPPVSAHLHASPVQTFIYGSHVRITRTFETDGVLLSWETASICECCGKGGVSASHNGWPRDACKSSNGGRYSIFVSCSCRNLEVMTKAILIAWALVSSILSRVHSTLFDQQSLFIQSDYCGF